MFGRSRNARKHNRKSRRHAIEPLEHRLLLSSVFLGDSLTLAGSWNDLLGVTSTENQGVGGNTTADMLARVGPAVASKPAQLFLMGGINDLLQGVSTATTEANYQQLDAAIQSQSPGTVIYLQSVLPVNDAAITFGYADPQKIVELNAKLRSLADGTRIRYVDLYPLFVGADGRTMRTDYTTDGLHLNPAGYQVWANAIRADFPGAGNLPYPGPNAAPAPGRIEAENFDMGGEGVAYHDLTGVNSGGQYRPSQLVDVEKSGDTGGGYDVGWNQPGEWLGYSVNVTASATYSLNIRAAYGGANATGGTVHLTSDGVDVSGPVTLPKTGGWQTWQTVTVTGVRLAAGQHMLKLVMDKDGAGSTANTAYLSNLNWLELSSGTTPTPPAGAPLPGKLEVENFDQGADGVAYHDLTSANSGGQYRTTGVDIEKTADVGGGYDVGWNQPGEWLNYTVNVASAGLYDVDIRAAYGGTNASGGTVHLDCDGVAVSGPITLPNTGGWQTWQTVTKAGVRLPAGQHVLKLVMDQDGAGSTANTAYLANINWLNLSLPVVKGPTGNLADPTNGGSIDASILNARRWIDVTYSGPNPLNASSITDSAPEFTLSGASAAGVTLRGMTTLVAPNTYRYGFSGRFDAGAVYVNFIGGSFVDSLGNAGAASTRKFTVVSLSSTDIGAVGFAGSTIDKSGIYLVRSSGADVWGQADACQFAYQTLTGDGQIIALVDSVANTDPWAKAGVMIRNSLAANSANAYVNLTADHGLIFQTRSSAGANTTESGVASGSAPYWVKLVRSGNTFTGYGSIDGNVWTQVGSAVTISMGSTVYIGLAGTAHSSAAIGTSVFSHVAIE